MCGPEDGGAEEQWSGRGVKLGFECHPRALPGVFGWREGVVGHVITAPRKKALRSNLPSAHSRIFFAPRERL